MSDKTKLAESIRKAKEAVDRANAALDDLMGELDDETLSAVTGGTGNPYEGDDRVQDANINDNDRPNFLVNPGGPGGGGEALPTSGGRGFLI